MEQPQRLPGGCLLQRSGRPEAALVVVREPPRSLERWDRAGLEVMRTSADK